MPQSKQEFKKDKIYFFSLAIKVMTFICKLILTKVMTFDIIMMKSYYEEV